MSEARAAPPQLHFDDGSRIMTEQQSPPTSTLFSPSARGSVSIEVFYEVDRLARKVFALPFMKSRRQDGWSCRVALQFPDDLLNDAPNVCWAMEEALSSRKDDEPSRRPLVFVLGDTTFGPCCPDEVSALHLEADVLIHYGHACLSPALSVPVLYSFGVTNINVDECVDRIVEQTKRESVENLMILYEVRYHHAMEVLKELLKERGDLLLVVGQIPEPTTPSNGAEEDCGADSEGHETDHNNALVVGGLELPANLDLSLYTLLFIGSGDLSNRQYVNTMLRFLSMPSGPSQHWTYSPTTQTLEMILPSNLQRQLNRRFFLTQKARDATVYGILVGTLSQRHFRSVVSSLRNAIEDAGKTCYTFAVGKINGAKLANFGEIDCFVLVACGENSLLDDERNLHVPVITPLELDIALGNVEWGSVAYSLDYNDFLSRERVSSQVQSSIVEDEDAPYYSLVSGMYMDSKKPSENSDLTTLPGKGQLAAYKSEASKALKKREYQGLEANIGETEVHAATPGQAGVASDYGDR